jgi:DNA repair protein RadA/Sms
VQGLRLDLPLALALASSLRDRPIAPGTVAVGEVGLLGELRTVSGIDRRLREAARLGFTRAIVPRPGRGALPAVPGLEVVPVGSLREAIRAAIGDTGGSGDGGHGGGRNGGRRSAPRVAEVQPPMLG